MTTESTAPDPSVVLELVSAFRKSKVLFAACELGVFDALQSASRYLCSMPSSHSTWV